MTAVLYILVVLIFSINFALGLPKVVGLVQSKVSANNIPSNRVINLGEDPYRNVQEIIKAPLPPASLGMPTPPVSATAIQIIDLETSQPLFSKDANKRVPIASTTKTVTALVASEHFKPNEILTVPSLAGIDGSTMGLKPEERLTFRSLLYGMLLNSGNDAAYTIADNFPGGVRSFVKAMNGKALQLGLTNTHFDNPAGFDSPSHFSSAADLAKVASLMMDNPQLSRVVATKETTVASVDKSIVHPLKNLNKLLDSPGVLGIKTGTTPAAKENLVALVERDGRKILTVVLGSNDRFGETSALIDWVYSNFKWE